MSFAKKYDYKIVPILLTVELDAAKKRMSDRLKKNPHAIPPTLKYIKEVDAEIEAIPMENQIVIDTSDLTQNEVIKKVLESAQ